MSHWAEAPGKTQDTLKRLLAKGPFMVLSPLSVLENWRKELESFAPSLTVLCYHGDKDRRAEMQLQASSQDFQVLLTTYELCLKDASFLRRWRWEVLVVDEAHRLKNPNSLLHQTLSEFSVDFRVLLTGTPIQNSLQELYSLLSFIQPSIFAANDVDSFVDYYSRVISLLSKATELQSVLEPFLLRRIKSEVAVDLPKKTELVVYHGMSALQKKYYKAILMKDPGEDWAPEQCVEPEPFEIGEHLIEASGKLCLLDNMLAYLHKGLVHLW
uniref:Helicase ATP-binding domain-containing protein n=1 Tax=Oryzias sinensis TaxID=183150 RepID=A0A8C7WTB0_9TELE